jgi:hypothetical protein
MIEEYLDLVAVLAMAVVALAAFLGLSYTSSPQCARRP